MKNKTLEKFKEDLHQQMVSNFKEYGYLVPIMFFYRIGHGQTIFPILPPFLASYEGKVSLSELIKKICLSPDVIAGGIIVEAHATRLSCSEDNELIKLIESGNIKVSELKEKRQDIIMMIFSSVEGEEHIIYDVDPATKTVGKKHPFHSVGEKDVMERGGLLTNLFNWKKN